MPSHRDFTRVTLVVVAFEASCSWHRLQKQLPVHLANFLPLTALRWSYVLLWCSAGPTERTTLPDISLQLNRWNGFEYGLVLIQGVSSARPPSRVLETCFVRCALFPPLAFFQHDVSEMSWCARGATSATDEFVFFPFPVCMMCNWLVSVVVRAVPPLFSCDDCHVICWRIVSLHSLACPSA